MVSWMSRKTCSPTHHKLLVQRNGLAAATTKMWGTVTNMTCVMSVSANLIKNFYCYYLAVVITICPLNVYQCLLNEMKP